MNSFTKIKIKSAKLGPLNPMPDIKNTGSVHASFKVGAGMDEEDTKYLGKGLVNTVAPYLMQDGYDRKLEDRFYKAVILENDKLKAIFLPEFGARLYSLFDKVHNKEYEERVDFQPYKFVNELEKILESVYNTIDDIYN